MKIGTIYGDVFPPKEILFPSKVFLVGEGKDCGMSPFDKILIMLQYMFVDVECPS